MPNTVVDEEGTRGARPDGRNLRAEFQTALYQYVWNTAGFNMLKSLPVLGLFESSHMEYEYDRPSDLGGEPSLKDMTVEAIQLAAYGGIYIVASLVWLWLAEGQRPTTADVLGAGIALVGALVIIGFAPKAP